MDWPGLIEELQVTVRLLMAAALGGLLGYERGRQGKAAGLRTHMLVSLGAAVFVQASVQGGASVGDLTRVVQGIATGIGFVGAGAILKHGDPVQIHGLTTATGIWLTAAVGTAVGAGLVWLPIVGTVLALLVLAAIRRGDDAAASGDRPRPPA
jgi:putative Mg2+ transporter-C (MgtC) family protein